LRQLGQASAEFAQVDRGGVVSERGRQRLRLGRRRAHLRLEFALDGVHRNQHQRVHLADGDSRIHRLRDLAGEALVLLLVRIGARLEGGTA
jgi:hypothetical protein